MEQQAEPERRWQGAEAVVELCAIPGIDTPVIRKHRFAKIYRHPDLDRRLTRQRTAQEARCLLKAVKAGLPCPAPICVVPDTGILMLEYIEGPKIKDVLVSESIDWAECGRMIGGLIARLHEVGMVHGDLTTSNMLWHAERVYLIDFGLAAMSSQVEDRAVDLYVLERAIRTTHGNQHPLLFDTILMAYYESMSDKNRQAVKKRFEEVQQRGRKRE